MNTSIVCPLWVCTNPPLLCLPFSSISLQNFFSPHQHIHKSRSFGFFPPLLEHTLWRHVLSVMKRMGYVAIRFIERIIQRQEGFGGLSKVVEGVKSWSLWLILSSWSFGICGLSSSQLLEQKSTDCELLKEFPFLMQLKQFQQCGNYLICGSVGHWHCDWKSSSWQRNLPVRCNWVLIK